MLQWQSSEGWFQEYEGFDPGYQTLTISLLAQLYKNDAEERLREPLTKAIQVAAEFIHPDGSYGGEYGSRNTYNFFPHGFEAAGRWLPEALCVNDRFLAGMSNGFAPCFEDDHIIGHHTWNYLLAWRDFAPRTASAGKPRAARVFLKEAGIVIDRRHDAELYVALNKGGVFKLFRGNELAFSDTQISIQLDDGAVAVAHAINAYEIAVSEDQISISGSFTWAKQTEMTTPKLVCFRIGMATIGRFFPNAVRKFLQKLLITGKNEAPFRFTRTARWDAGQWKITDEVRADDWSRLQAAGIGPAQTSIYVVMSRTFQNEQLQNCLDLTDAIKRLKTGEVFKLERNY